ncbi:MULTISPECIES: hypothetical protein [Bacillus]|uniref:S-layer protein n=1 Tax=Bacillus paramycoides TaxID=2026194 RepID=A0ABU6N437_9BACI|nr:MULTISPECIES: hypothetical protein [Bacillus]KMN42449.1 hypothetical protein VK90_24185 [Bacillus sp. LK2]MED1569736.1 hypothetical protein [Bacillus paramycoides]PFD35113.1 hypothetical protein CN285_24340 [Bacillus cereus]PGM53227.1 hypothetical protein CN947_26305 [Bacillus cereus]
MKKVIGLIVTLFLLFSTYAPTFTEAAEVLNKVGWVKENENWYFYEKDGSKRTETIRGTAEIRVKIGHRLTFISR